MRKKETVENLEEVNKKLERARREYENMIEML